MSGDAGVGKSRLVAEALADWDGCLLRGAATAGAGAYGPIAEILRAVSNELGDDALLDRIRVLLRNPATPPEADSLALAGAVERALRSIGRRQATVVVLEDVHWASAATVELLPVLAAAMADEPVLLLATYRSDELPRAHPVRRMRTELRRGGRFVEFALRPLGAEETGELLAGLLDGTPSPELVSAVHERAEGLPFFVEELAAALVEAGALRALDGRLDLDEEAVLPLPDSVLDAVLARTEGLRRQQQLAVELAAVLGVRVDLAVLADLVAPSDVDQLLDAGLLSEHTADSAAFRHALVRDALYRAIPWARRRAHHRLVAEHLTARGAPAETIAGHWMAAREHERARPLLVAAAERYCAVHAYRDATALARSALAIWPAGTNPDDRIGVLERLADCAELCGELGQAEATWIEVARLRRAEGDLARAGSAHHRAANAAELLGDAPGAIAAREAAADAFAAGGARGDAAAERLALAEQLKSAAHHTRALEQAVAATEDAEAAARVDLKARALALQGAARAALGDGPGGVELARSGLELALSGRLSETAGQTYYELAEALEYTADYAAAADAYEAAFELCRQHGVTELAQVCYACLSPVLRLMGDWDRSLAICSDVLGDDSTPHLLRMVAEEESGLVTVLRGDRARARGPLRRAAAFGRASEIFGIEVGASWGLAMVADLDGNDATALRVVSTVLERCLGKEEWHYALPALRWAATFLGTRGEREGLALCHRLLATAATRNSAPKVLSALAHAGGELALVDGDAAQASAQFGPAVELLHDVTAPFERALSQLRWGASLAAGGHHGAAVDTVTSAYGTARHLGAKPLARGCATQLADMGEQVDRRLGRLAARSLEPAGLTRREREVLRLLAGGRTNRQIAKELFLSTRTVDMHVRNMLGKLGCSSRMAGVRRAAELGLIEASAGQPSKVRQ